MLSFGLSASLVLAVSCAAAVQGGRPPDKGSRTPAQRKLDSHLLQEIARRQGKSSDAPEPGGATLVKTDKDARALVDVRAPVTARLQERIRGLKGTIVSTSAQYDSTIAWVPVLQLETLAEDPAVVAIVPAAEAITNKKRLNP